MKTILITGASTGIGRATADYFAQKDWRVAATMRHPENTDFKEQDNLKKFQLDVQDKSSIAKTVNDVLEEFHKIDVVLNNAGYGTCGPLEAATDQQLRRQFDVNVFGLIDVTKAVLPHFRKMKKGMFINVSSIGGLVTFPTFSAYHATKWAVEGLTESLQYELNPLGITMKLIEPGGVKTDFATRSLDLFDYKHLEEYDQTMERISKLFTDSTERSQNYSTAEQMAEVIYEAATDGKSQLRYVAGKDANQIWTARQNMPYEDFREMIRDQFLGD
ncbi:SDR family oxidoreductase [Fulvivirgaceae bacterium BMA10]|uniref:SDR family oxidoreductase n=1 Tax=Splendidivirga corallicola TaxID=3051826 RepID=A0ABT8KHY9_9BACT|nr:SDR family oxidoreductase [Fulvivirgaceae bacterium BMA10]